MLGVPLSERETTIHELIPPHRVLPKEEGEKILAEFKISQARIPKIHLKDAALVGKGAKAGQIVEIKRLDGSLNYRLIVDE